jgi:hypothetical protein
MNHRSLNPMLDLFLRAGAVVATTLAVAACSTSGGEAPSESLAAVAGWRGQDLRTRGPMRCIEFFN